MVPGSESASPGPVLSPPPLRLSLLHSQNWPRRRIVLRSLSHDLIPSPMSSVVNRHDGDGDLLPAPLGDLISGWTQL